MRTDRLLKRLGVAVIAMMAIAAACSSSPPSTAETVRPLGPEFPKIYVDPVPPKLDDHNDRVLPLLALAPVAAPPFPYESTFRLHSLAGANRVIYLDFDGATIADTAWNNANNLGPFFAGPFDNDGNPAFSNSELEIIQGVWQRVAEDYAPFSVDVTTEFPGDDALNRANASDLNFGVRALITNTTTIFNTCGCGGVEWVGVFDETNSRYFDPAFVFQRGIGPVEKNLAEAASHEVGHSVGLGHDGSSTDAYYGGGGAWAPIMGVSYYRPLTQWSKGDYPNATNTENDYATMASNGLTLRADDHGDTLASATPLAAVRNGTGVISTPGDADLFSFTTSGGEPLSFAVKPVSRGPNLDLSAEILDASGAILVAADPASIQPSSANPDSIAGIDAVASVTLPAGTYYLRVQGVGKGSPSSGGYSDYGSIGAYSFSAAVVPPPQPTLSITDINKFEGDGNRINFSFAVTLSAASTTPVTVTVRTSNGTALSSSDYAAKTQTISFAPGQVRKFFVVSVRADGVKERDETFNATLSNPSGATLADAQGVAIVRNDD